METSRVIRRSPAMSWEAQNDILRNAHPAQNYQQFGYAENFARPYPASRPDGTLAGLVIGTIAGVVAAALMLGNVIGPMW